MKRSINITSNKSDENAKCCLKKNCSFNWCQKKIVDRKN